ncbi:MAG: glycosyltransferase family 2 protein [Butyrivibrio sp.]|nr:glycosyltransferase family 2 protein [Butyrivibrio sp.]
MSNLKAFLKKFPLAYLCYSFIKRVYIQFLRIKLLMVRFTKKDKDLPTYREAYVMLSKLRKEPTFGKNCGTMEIDKKIDLSVIVPIYNSERYLSQCLNSIKFQETSYNFQVICVDDGSTDLSAQIVDRYQDDSRFIIIHQANMGHSGARNTALKHKLGKYVMFIDSDDYICAGYIEKMLNAAYEQGADIVQGSYKKCNAESKTLESVRCKDGKINSYRELEKLGGVPWGRIYNTQLWENVYYPEGMMFEDTIIFNIIFRRATYVYGISDALYMYRIYGENTLDKLQGDIRLLDAVWSVRYSLKESNRLNLEKNNDYYEFLLSQCSKHVYYRIMNMDKNVQKACFVIMCNVVEEYSDYKKIVSNDKEVVLQELEDAFMERNFAKWVICSKMLKLSCG